MNSTQKLEHRITDNLAINLIEGLKDEYCVGKAIEVAPETIEKAWESKELAIMSSAPKESKDNLNRIKSLFIPK